MFGASRRASATVASKSAPSRRSRAQAEAMSPMAPAVERVSTISIRASPICCAVTFATEYVVDNSVAIVRTRSSRAPSRIASSYTSRHSPKEGVDVVGFARGSRIFS